MIKNYFKTAWRNLLKNKASSFINISGLATGMAVAILIGLWIWDELSFNKSFKNYDRIAQVLTNAKYNGGIGTDYNTAPPYGDELRNSFGTDFKHVLTTSRANTIQTIAYTGTSVGATNAFGGPPQGCRWFGRHRPGSGSNR